MKKVVLAFSGGLDTSFCAVYLSRVKGLEVHAITINTGGFEPAELEAIMERAYALGVKHAAVIEATAQFYDSTVKYLIFGNVLKNNTYPLSVSAERVCQATAIAKYAQEIGADYVAHGSTGAGNDQVRFDMIFQTLIPHIGIITPIRDLKLSRQQEIDFLKEHGVEMNTQKAQYSINKGLWGTSVGGKETLTSDTYLPDEAFPTQLTATAASLDIVLHFVRGELRGINEQTFAHPIDAIQALEKIAAPFAVGRDIHIGDTIIGIKGRVGFEAAAPLIIIKAHHTLEKHTLTKHQLIIKEQLAVWYGNWLHEGLFLDPVMRNMEAFLEDSQAKVTGKVSVRLLPYRFVVLGIESVHDLMSAKFGAYGEMNNTWSGEDVKGFSKIFGNALAIYHQVNTQSQSIDTQ